MDKVLEIVRNIVGLPDWHVLRMISAENGMLIEGACVLQTYKSGPRKGKPNLNKIDSTTLRRVVVTDAMLKN